VRGAAIVGGKPAS